MEDENKTGILLNANNIKIHRQYFREMVKLIGVYALYRAPKPDKNWTIYAELESNYEQPIQVGCIFDQHLTQQTMKKIGWDAELNDQRALIHVDYDLPSLQVGCLFILPSGIDNAPSRIFRVVKLTNSMIYPASMMCEVVPEWEDTIVRGVTYDNHGDNFRLLTDEDSEYFNRC